MSLVLDKKATTWAAQLYIRGKKQRIPLCIPVAGKRPKSLRDRGDAEFERSRAKALVAHDEKQALLKDPIEAIAAADRLVELTTSKHSRVYSVFELFDLWKAADPDRSSGTIANQSAYYRNFSDFMRCRFPGVEDVRLVDSHIVATWFESLRQQGIKNETFKKYATALSGGFRIAAAKANLKSNPFKLVDRPKSHPAAIAHRVPFTAAEIEKIFDACESDSLIGPVVILAASTAMRRGDCCCLEWSSVNLKDGMILTNASKNEGALWIPIFSNLRKVLEARPRKGRYVFPEVAAIYLAEKDNKNSLLLALKRILKRAGIDYDERNEFKSRHRRLRAPSRAGWHAFKTMFCTLALANNMPIELLLKITGNKAVELVRQNYNRPDMLSLARVATAAMPPELTGDRKDGAATPREIVSAMTAKNWRESRELLLRLLP